MKKIKLLKHVCLGLLVINFSSCNKNEEDLQPLNMKMTSVFFSDETIIGEQIDDPYNIENMRETLHQIINENQDFPIQEIEPTGKYIRVLPTSEEDLDLIEEDTNLVWFDYPMNHDLVYIGSYYHDPTVDDTNFTWMYTVIPMDYQFPSQINYEEIYEVFIPDDAIDYEEKMDFYDELEYRSISLTEDDEEPVVGINCLFSGGNKWTPSATIRTWDDVKNDYYNHQGVRVKVKQAKGCKSGFAVTDANGHCTLNKQFKNKVNYTIEWLRNDWRITLGSKNATYSPNGSNLEEAWNVSIDHTNHAQLMIATIHRAALQAFYSNSWSIQKPKAFNKLRIKYNNYTSTTNGLVGTNYCYWNRFGLRQNIDIWGYDSHGERTTEGVFGTVLHELAHQSHKKFVGQNKWNIVKTNLFICESWARCIEWKIATDYYRNLTGNNSYNYCDGLQSWRRPQNTTQDDSTLFYYTPVFIDLIDTYNQNGKDYISNYTLNEIQNNLIENATNLNSLSTQLHAHKLHGATDSQVDSLLNNYINLEAYGIR